MKFQFQGFIRGIRHSVPSSLFHHIHLLGHGLRGLLEHFLNQLDKHLHTAITKQNEESRHHRLHLCTINRLNYKNYLIYLGIGAISTPPVALSIFLMSP